MSFAKLVNPGSKVDLAVVDPSAPKGLTKEEGEAQVTQLGEKLRDLQELHFAAGENPLLIVLQGCDTSGKDGTIRNIIQFMNPQSTRVASFKVPTPNELAHDFLWRIHQQTPGKGETVIFNRSHYEDVLVVRVHEYVPKAVWQKRYDTINEFEESLVEAGTIVVKFFLYISKDEQEERLLERQQDPRKAWKLSVGDWKERELWDSYIEAYETALSECSTKQSPWHVVPANNKWFRDLAVVETIYEAMKPFEAAWQAKLDAIGVKAKAEIEAYKKGV
jgi:PPK2 family polyphosphate:nucleotide phosphotransferase